MGVKTRTTTEGVTPLSIVQEITSPVPSPLRGKCTIRVWQNDVRRFYWVCQRSIDNHLQVSGFEIVLSLLFCPHYSASFKPALNRLDCTTLPNDRFNEARRLMSGNKSSRCAPDGFRSARAFNRIGSNVAEVARLWPKKPISGEIGYGMLGQVDFFEIENTHLYETQEHRWRFVDLFEQALKRMN